MRGKYILEGYRSLAIGNIITMFVFSHIHQIFDRPVEVAGFFVGMALIATYCTWTVFILIEKCRDALGSRPGNRIFMALRLFHFNRKGKI